MRIEILCTGDEILSGKTVNTNYSHIAGRLGDVGLSVTRGTTVGDDRDRLIDAFRQAAKRADAVIVNGGLGPTVDDLSQEVAAEAAGVELELHRGWLQRIEQYYTSRGREMPPNNRKQAMLPAGAEFIDNPIGTACGFALAIDGARFFFTPGVPREMKCMLDEQIIPRLLSMSGLKAVIKLKRFHTFGLGESRVDQLLAGVEKLAPRGSVKLGFQSHYPQLETKLTVRADNVADIDSELAPVEAAVRERLGNFVVAEDDQTLEQRILQKLGANGGTLSTMEMFTGGSIAARLLPAAGSDDLFKRGVVSRHPAQLAAAAGLNRDAYKHEVSTRVAVALAEGLRTQSGSSHALVVQVSLDLGKDRINSGGDVFIGIADEDTTRSRHARMLGGRQWVRLGAIEMGLDCLRRHLFGLPVDEKIDFEKH